MSPPSLEIVPLGEADLEFAEGLRAAEGWNQTPRDWRRLLEHEPSGCWLGCRDGRPIGTVTTTCHGGGIAWIGMMLVAPAHRGRGVATALMAHCLDDLERRGVGCVRLDATPAGRPVYERLGFVAEWTWSRWAGELTGPRSSPDSSAPWSDERPRGGVEAPATSLARRVGMGAPSGGLDELLTLDLEAFGADRSVWLRRLLTEARSAWAPNGYGLLRPGSRAASLGPLVARDETTAKSLVEELLASHAGPLFWDLPDSHLAAQELARERGLAPVRELVRMRRGRPPAPDDPGLQFGLGCPATG